MLTKEIKYENLDGVMVTEVHNFNLNLAEAVEMNFSRRGGVEAYARQIFEAEDHGTLVELFKELILKTYGRREGQEFEKDEAFTKKFVNTGAYSALFIELATNADSAVEFFRGVVPASMQSRVDEAVKADAKEHTDDELLAMPWDEFTKMAGGPDEKNWDKRFLILGFRRKSAQVV